MPDASASALPHRARPCRRRPSRVSRVVPRGQPALLHAHAGGRPTHRLRPRSLPTAAQDARALRVQRRRWRDAARRCPARAGERTDVVRRQLGRRPADPGVGPRRRSRDGPAAPTPRRRDRRRRCAGDSPRTARPSTRRRQRSSSSGREHSQLHRDPRRRRLIPNFFRDVGIRDPCAGSRRREDRRHWRKATGRRLPARGGAGAAAPRHRWR